VVTTDVPDARTASAVLDADLRAALTEWADSEGLSGPWSSLLVECGVADEHAQTLHRIRVRNSLVCEAEAIRVVEQLTSAGVESWLLKGIAAANVDHADPAMRTGVDVDLLVRRTDVHRAVDVLERSGHRRAEAAPRRGWERRYARTLLLLGPAHVELDLHLTLATGYFGAVLPMDELLARSHELSLGGVPCRTLGLTGRALHSSYAAVLNRGARLRYLRDLALQITAPRMDIDELVALAERADGQAVVARAVAQAVRAELIDPTHRLAEWALSVQPSRRAARALAFSDAAPAVGWSADARSAMLALGPVAKLRYLMEFAVPRRGSGRRAGQTWRSAVRFVRSR
jgi:hypothetical protein